MIDIMLCRWRTGEGDECYRVYAMLNSIPSADDIYIGKFADSEVAAHVVNLHNVSLNE